MGRVQEGKRNFSMFDLHKVCKEWMPPLRCRNAERVKINWDMEFTRVYLILRIRMMCRRSRKDYGDHAVAKIDWHDTGDTICWRQHLDWQAGYKATIIYLVISNFIVVCSGPSEVSDQFKTESAKTMLVRPRVFRDLLLANRDNVPLKSPNPSEIVARLSSWSQTVLTQTTFKSLNTSPSPSLPHSASLDSSSVDLIANFLRPFGL